MIELIILFFRGVAQLVARDIWDVEAAGSTPVTPTKKLIWPQIAAKSAKIKYLSPEDRVP